jgi:hypothetical protein
MYIVKADRPQLFLLSTNAARKVLDILFNFFFLLGQ